MLSSSEDADADNLIVKLDGFGFGKWFTHQQMQQERRKKGEAPLPLGRQMGGMAV